MQYATTSRLSIPETEKLEFSVVDGVLGTFEERDETAFEMVTRVMAHRFGTWKRKRVVEFVPRFPR